MLPSPEQAKHGACRSASGPGEVSAINSGATDQGDKMLQAGLRVESCILKNLGSLNNGVFGMFHSGFS